jgi:hypothetical protein
MINAAFFQRNRNVFQEDNVYDSVDGSLIAGMMKHGVPEQRLGIRRVRACRANREQQDCKQAHDKSRFHVNTS